MNIKIDLFRTGKQNCVNPLRNTKIISSSNKNEFDKDIISNFILNDITSRKSPQD